jgi:hypothetical protein
MLLVAVSCNWRSGVGGGGGGGLSLIVMCKSGSGGGGGGGGGGSGLSFRREVISLSLFNDLRKMVSYKASRVKQSRTK